MAKKDLRTRVYHVTEKDSGTVRLIRGPNKTAATAQASQKRFTVRVASQDDLEELLPRGVKVERYEPPEVEPVDDGQQQQPPM